MMGKIWIDGGWMVFVREVGPSYCGVVYRRCLRCCHDSPVLDVLGKRVNWWKNGRGAQRALDAYAEAHGWQMMEGTDA